MQSREQEVWERLAQVVDPELDESVTELKFVTAVEVGADGRVRLCFRLPTYWCAANFAYLMADDMRRAVGGLAWVRGVTLELGEHMYADEINQGVSEGRSFKETFGAAACEDDVEEVRRVFLIKAFQRRQAALLDHLLEAGHAAPDVLGLSIAGAEGLRLEPDGRDLARRYLERRGVVGRAEPHEPAFVDAQAAAIAPDSLPTYRRELRRVAVNAEFNGALCRGLLAARFGEEPAEPKAEPELIDFIRALPPQRHAGEHRD